MRRLQYTLFWLAAGSALFSKLGSLLEDEEEESKPTGVKEAVRQVKKATEGERIGPEGEVELEHNESQAEEVSDDDDIVPEEQPDDALFIPMGWPQQRPKEFYKGSDPEWQSFLEFAHNEKRGRSVRNELAAIIGSHLSEDSRMQKILGSPIAVKKYWLDVDFPYGPPQEYEQSGIEITDDYIAWVVRTVDPINVARLKVALSPTPLLYSMWESYKALWESIVAKARKILDMEAPNKRYPPGFALPKLEEQKEGGDEQSKSAAKSLVASSQSQGQWTKMLASLPLPGEDYAHASRAFKKTLAKNWSKGMSLEPPRGTLLISGLVELYGPKGFCVLDVRAAYEPRASQWVAVSIGLRRAQPRVQKPKG